MECKQRVFLMFIALAGLPATGCVESQGLSQSTPFERQELDDCLAICIDMSGSFRHNWDDRAYDLFMDISDRFFTEAMGNESRIIITQLSGEGKVVLFEGRPDDLQQKFQSPEDLNQYLLDHSDGGSSQVYRAMSRTLDHIGSMSGVTQDTRVLTIVFSDMQDTGAAVGNGDADRTEMMKSLRRYADNGGGLALYFVARDQVQPWRQILSEAGFEPGHFIIENDLTSSPQLPRFE